MLPAWTLVSDCIMSWEMSVFCAAGAAAVKSLKSSVGICPAPGGGGCNIAGVGTDAAAGASAAAGRIGAGAAATGSADDVKLPNSSSFWALLANDAGGGAGAAGRAGAACAAACTASLGELNSESIKCGLGAGRSKSAAVNCAGASNSCTRMHLRGGLCHVVARRDPYLWLARLFCRRGVGWRRGAGDSRRPPRR